VEKIATGIESIEAQAEKMLEEARKRATEIMLKTREECRSIALEELPLEETKADCEKVLVQAREEARRIAAESEKRVAEIKTTAKRKTEKIISSIVKTVTGETN
jgi:hypothetical protein